MPKVSIVIPVFNVELYLRECLDSVVNQTLTDIEIICVNDGSTDNSLSILMEYAENDERIKVINKKNTGYGHTMNVGIDEATGEYIGIVESDDYVKKNMYENLYEAATTYNLDFVKADYEIFVGDGKQRKFKYVSLSKDKSNYNKVLNPWDNVRVFTFYKENWSGIYNRNFINKNNIRHNETPGASFQDNGFWFQVFCHARRIMFIDKPFYQLRRDNPNSSVFSREKVFCVFEEYNFIKNFLESNPAIKKRFIYIYSRQKYMSCMFHYNRIAEEYKLDFLKRFCDDFKLAEESGELDKNLFSSEDWKKLNQIINDPEKYYYQTKLAKPLEINEKKSILRKTIHYLAQNGIKQTLKRLKVEIKNKF